MEWFHLAGVTYPVFMLRDGQQGRRVARALIALAVGWGLGALFLGLALPAFVGDLLHEPWYVTALLIAGVASYFIGLGWMVRIYRAHSEPGERTWRYRDRDDTARGPVLRTLEPAVGTSPDMTTDGRRGRRIARGLIVLAIVYGLVAVLFYVTQTGFMDPMFGPRERSGLPIVGIASYLLGLGWMVRIYRAKPEPGERTWRYRDF